ncbi:protein artemis [Tribolium castaneum]|uniref:Protein artemis-like Protein n=1 Tax=Tribolium castaneum TaxID=7070 RepID=D6WZE5_TRICA|nr:PREDICTED: protein artemis [Tribolium castaneum]EFA09718.1 Protein artemis-like Protein [Tribolium castaneum]|eukprot:XP_969213.1 PREDICTED: protein artemis [Tribolium castaneum]
MSTFGGTLAEIPGISVDRFDGANLDSEAFFLSHCHTDHMKGLEAPEFHEKLAQNRRFLYLSHVSAEIVRRMFPKIGDNLIELDMRSPTSVFLQSGAISVTPIPAGHCPGSIMFLFEAQVNVLYTGDYRINPRDIPKFTAFYDSLNAKKRIEAVYLDTTFFLKSYAKFPPRAESLEEICSIISDWISRSDKHVIGLDTSAKYGYEYLFIEIYKQIKMPIHVNDEIYEFYSRVPEMDRAVTRSKDTRIHSACGTTYRTVCPNTVHYNVKVVKVSAFRWKSESLQNGISEKTHNTHFVCYSTHASFEEGVELVKFLEPRKVEANVLHRETAEEILRNIRECLGEEGPKTKKVKLFEADEEERVREVGERGFGELSSILDSPPRKYT